MGRIREMAEQSWSGAIEPYTLWKPTGATEEIAPGVFFLHAFANVTVLRAGDGLVLIDTASQAVRDRTFAAVRAIDPAPVRAATAAQSVLIETRGRGGTAPDLLQGERAPGAAAPGGSPDRAIRLRS